METPNTKPKGKSRCRKRSWKRKNAALRTQLAIEKFQSMVSRFNGAYGAMVPKYDQIRQGVIRALIGELPAVPYHNRLHTRHRRQWVSLYQHKPVEAYETETLPDLIDLKHDPRRFSADADFARVMENDAALAAVDWQGAKNVTPAGHIDWDF